MRTFALLAPFGFAAAAVLALTAISPVAEAHRPPVQRQHEVARTTGDIVAVARGAGQFTTLLAAAEAAGLLETLQGPGPLTVFAPTDAAFNALPHGTVQSLLRPENRERLRALISYHVTSGRITAADLAGRTAAPVSANGAILAIDGRNGVRVNNATVIAADVAASNGVIHVIDAVLMPF